MSSSDRLTPEQRVLRARIGALAAHAKHGRKAMTAAARAVNPSNDDYWVRKVDPEHTLDRAERENRATDAKRAYFAALALKSARARGRKARTHGRSIVPGVSE